MNIGAEAGFILRVSGASNSEAESIYKLRFNEPDLHFFSDTHAPSFENHLEWLTSEVGFGRSIYFIAENLTNAETIGFVRFENARGSANWVNSFENFDEVWLVSFATRSDLRNRGLGTAMIKHATDRFLVVKKSSPVTLLTWAIPSNLASWKCFIKNGWEKKFIDGFREVVIYSPERLP
ncbi:MAG: GNAT family N-acetyltransferase [Gammaproteobacteria bacterium]